MTKKLATICFLGLALVAFQMIRYFASGDFRERRAVLTPLLRSNAPLNVVTQVAGNFTIWRRGTPMWDQVHGQYKRGSKWDRHIGSKMEESSATGHTSTMWMQTWIFLDEQDRLVGFELGTQ